MHKPPWTEAADKIKIKNRPSESVVSAKLRFQTACLLRWRGNSGARVFRLKICKEAV
ncbi:hypothetical protein HMPREF9123_2359 [Neisseria bacilliformis ATCC BAA-1200]|uniref:Uncharacterized protein n=1 Tax=Neisseria bacilliformis ATCC BAA-1200 TaxID=888742 RepID=F2BF52_9NEIS|nr:hypothetical protein HMPREF9123_2359 [Neisseria bacilliformis ATCC BAA-1200]